MNNKFLTVTATLAALSLGVADLHAQSGGGGSGGSGGGSTAGGGQSTGAGPGTGGGVGGGQPGGGTGTGQSTQGLAGPERGGQDPSTGARGSRDAQQGTQGQGGQAQQNQGGGANRDRSDANMQNRPQSPEGAQPNTPSERQAREKDDRQQGQQSGGRDQDRANVESKRVTIDNSQRTRIKTVIKEANPPRAKVNFNVVIGERVPSTVTYVALPPAIIEIVPQYRAYRYVMVGDSIVIIEPDTGLIIDVIPA
jgi:hypothetical protein